MKMSFDGGKIFVGILTAKEERKQKVFKQKLNNGRSRKVSQIILKLLMVV